MQLPISEEAGGDSHEGASIGPFHRRGEPWLRRCATAGGRCAAATYTGGRRCQRWWATCLRRTQRSLVCPAIEGGELAEECGWCRFCWGRDQAG